MEPGYFIENRYSFVVDALPLINNVEYEVDTPETHFERSVQRQLALANRLLMVGKYSSALAKYRHVRGLIAATMRPQISVINATLLDHSKIGLEKFAEPLVAKSAELLRKTPVTNSTLPGKFRSSDISLPADAIEQLAPFEKLGIKDDEAMTSGLLDQAVAMVDNQEFDKASILFESVLKQTKDDELRGTLLHDIAVMQERTGERDKALQTMQRAIGTFEQNKNHDSQVIALTILAGIQARGDNDDAAKETLKTVGRLQDKHNLFPIVAGRNSQIAGTLVLNPALGRSDIRPTIGGGITRPITPTVDPIIRREVRSESTLDPRLQPQHKSAMRAALTLAEIEAQPVTLLAADAFAQRKTQKQMTILDSTRTATRVRLDNNAAQDLRNFYSILQTTHDVGLLMGYLQSHTITVAYLTHVYSWVIPMAVGDCQAALGSFEDAEREYLSTLNYPFLNEVVETVNLWLRLAELYLDWGDRLYRQARNDVSEFSKAREKYENVLLLNNTIRADSPLYQSAKFNRMATRVNTAIQAIFVSSAPIIENPRVLIALRRARHQIFKIDNELNFIGLGVHIPPFSFEHLQNLARYFAQHASQVEQMYIQFKSTGENEELREEQMAQQAELAAASVELERRGLDEAEEGVDVANANLNYTNIQLSNAQQARNQFNNVRAELLELDTLQAWASASAVDRDDQVELSISGYAYYSAKDKRRNVVLKEIASRRTRISHKLEEGRLQREIASAQAYSGIAQQQVQQAQARVEVAAQRIEIAKLQEQHAQENLEFLTGREFSSAMWYNLSREARRLAQRYLDMGIEVATLMEKAYEAETGRDLRKIKFEYGLDRLNGLLGAEALLLDVDYFSLDFVRTKSKKAQMKQIISMADTFPMAFNRLLQTGQTFFETTLAHFDRRYPGFYLQKVKQVEMVFVGLNGTEGVHGTLRNIGLSQFRQKSGNIVNQTYPADVMPLSEYNVKQDAIVFQLDGKELRLFENNGIATMWQLDLPRGTNTFNLSQILDIQMILYYDGFFNQGLEQQIIAALPGTGSGSRALSLRLYAPDELFFLKSQGTAELAITHELFPANQTNQTLTRYRIQGVGDVATVDGLNVRIEFANLGAAHTFQLDSEGNADGAVFTGPVNQSLFDTWTIFIDTADNLDVDLANLDDIALYIEYDFDYRD